MTLKTTKSGSREQVQYAICTLYQLLIVILVSAAELDLPSETGSIGRRKSTYSNVY